MLFKLGLKNIKRNLIMNILIIFQMTIVFIVCISMVSTIVSRFMLYSPFSKELNSKGYFFCINNGINPTTGNTMVSNEELCDLIEDEETVSAVYSPWLSYNNNEINCLSYDREYIEKFTPELASGMWLNTNEKISDIVHTVVSQNQYNLNVGDVVKLNCFDTVIKAEIVGILKENSKIIDFSVSTNGIIDCRNLYNNYNFKYEEKPLFIFYQNELTNKPVVTQLNGPVIINYPDSISDDKIESNNFKIRKMMTSAAIPLEKLKENSLNYIFSQLYDMMPIFICVFLLTIVGALSMSALSVKQQLNNYAVYYICGLKWKKCAIVNFWSSFICVIVSFLISIIVVAYLKSTKTFGETVIEMGFWQLFGCLSIIIIYVLLSMILPIQIIGSNTANKILKSN